MLHGSSNRTLAHRSTHYNTKGGRGRPQRTILNRRAVECCTATRTRPRSSAVTHLAGKGHISTYVLQWSIGLKLAFRTIDPNDKYENSACKVFEDQVHVVYVRVVA
jgi:hypothetical protein